MELAGNLPISLVTGNWERDAPPVLGLMPCTNQMHLPKLHIHCRLQNRSARAKGLQLTEKKAL